MLKDEIIQYVDGNGLVVPHLAPPGAIRGSDNGVMYYSEYVILLAKRGELSSTDIGDFVAKIGPCFQTRGLLARAPGARDQEGPDDYHGVLAACVVLDLPEFARDILAYGQ